MKTAIYFGISDLDLLKEKKFKINFNAIGHGLYILGTHGWKYSHEYTDENYLKIEGKKSEICMGE